MIQRSKTDAADHYRGKSPSHCRCRVCLLFGIRAWVIFFVKVKVTVQ